MNKKQRLVYQVIQTSPWVANNDADLIAAVWRKEGWDDSRSLEDNIKQVTRPETITRARRKLHEDGFIQYSKEADGRRYEAFLNARDEYGTPPLGRF